MKIPRLKLPKITFKFLIVIILLYLVFISWSFGSAVGSTPDEDYVLTSIWCGTYQKSLKDPNEKYLYRETTKFDGTVKPATKYCLNDFLNHEHAIVPVLVGRPQACYLEAGQDFSAECQIALRNETTSVQFNPASTKA